MLIIKIPKLAVFINRNSNLQKYGVLIGRNK